VEYAERIASWEKECDRLRRAILSLEASLASQGPSLALHDPSVDSSELSGRNAAPTRRPSEQPGSGRKRSAPTNPAPEVEELDDAAKLRRELLMPLLERQQELSRKFGPDHAELRDVRRRIEILTEILSTRNLPPADVIPLLVEERLLLDQFGPAHPKVQDIRKRIREKFESSQAISTAISGQNAPGQADRDRQLNRQDVAESLPERIRGASSDARTDPVEVEGGSERGSPRAVPDVSAHTTSGTREEQLAALQRALAQAQHAAEIARYEWLLQTVRQELVNLQIKRQAAEGQFRVLSHPSAARLNWQRDLVEGGCGAVLGCLAALVVSWVGSVMRQSGPRVNPSA
jgi:hypothetical protein